MMGACRDCRWWATDKGWAPGNDTTTVAVRGWHPCRLMETRSGGVVQDGARAAAWECCNYGGEVMTAPDFGCVQFAPVVSEVPA